LSTPAITRVALLPGVTAVAAQIAIPTPQVPFTLQVLAVILSGLLLGMRHGALAQAVYVFVGAAGCRSSPSSRAGWAFSSVRPAGT
jgi:biotin transport system substrate-specific component